MQNSKNYVASSTNSLNKSEHERLMEVLKSLGGHCNLTDAMLFLLDTKSISDTRIALKLYEENESKFKN